MDFVGAREVSRLRREQKSNAARGESDATSRAEQRQHTGFDDELLGEPGAARAECQAKADLSRDEP